MSPSEAHLRAALHDGEGSELDADRLISHAVGVRRDRRRRITAVTGGATLVALVGIGGSVLFNSNDTGGGSSDSAAGRTAPHAAASTAAVAGGAPPAASATRGYAAANGTATRSGGPCPVRPDQFLLPGGGGSGQFGSTDPLFPHGASTIRVCAYPVKIGSRVRTTVLENANATTLAATIDAAPATTSVRCPTKLSFVSQGTVEVIATDAEGRSVEPVVITTNCPLQATNGTGVRYLRSLPTALTELLRVIPDRTLEPVSPGVNQGSPPK